jgi:L-2,4-diaminobutyrate decarboxylase
MDSMHRYTEETEELAQAILKYTVERMKLDPVPVDGAKTKSELDELCGDTITRDGIGGLKALQLFDDVLSRACMSCDHPRYLSFIPSAPTEAASLFDLVVGASSIYAGSWLEGAGAIWAENQALRYIMDTADYPENAGGVFVSGGTTGNLSALVAARHRATTLLEEQGKQRPNRWIVAASAEAHSSIEHASRVMDCDALLVPADADGRLTGAELAKMIEERGGADDIFAIVATMGTTNYGIIDDIAGLADVAEQYGIWLHVDGAYGGAGLAAPSVRHLYNGIERSDSFIVDPHKWLYSPFDACALLYRDPNWGRSAHTQHAGYLDVIDNNEWNPSDFAIHLSRRARGLPLWFSLATHGTEAYEKAIEWNLEVARYAVDEINRRPYLEVIRKPGLSVVVFRRIGWSDDDYNRWSQKLVDANYAFVTPTKHKPTGETCTRFAIINPRTTKADISGILDTMA